ncbi:MAG: polymer-forming cytoskeletal protein [Lachnospiraceae bacterium]|nr:polymer-forming cytoskeletal protein [Lachnospiraceae bacterium]
MGLFKDFKDDFSQAVNELVPGGEEVQAPEETASVESLKADMDVTAEKSKLNGLLVDETPAPTPVVNVASNASANVAQSAPVQNNGPEVVDETSTITSGTVLTGDLTSNGHFDIQGTINGNVKCLGKLVVTGTINGNSESSEFFADASKIAGEVACSGTVKIGAGSVIIGNITATSAVIAGAVKGDIDVQGPVVVDTSAVVMGNIKSRSVQINNGAVIEGFCSQAYADIDMQTLFNI